MLNEPLVSDRGPQQPPTVSATLLVFLYAGHFLARWGARMWEFSVGLYMISIWPDSLLLTAAYGVVESASTAFFGPVIGQWVDKLTYTKVLKIWLLSQNLSFVVAGGSVIVLLVYKEMLSENYLLFILLVLLTNISGAVGVLSTLAGTILVEREWVVVISNGQSPRVLSNMNSTIRRIDLICKLFAPVVVGFIVSFVSLTASAMSLALWNVASVCLQYWLLMSVYNGISSLSESNERRVLKSTRKNLESSSARPPTDGYIISSGLEEIDPEHLNHGCLSKLIGRIARLPYVGAWKVYLKQDVVLAGISLSILFCSVLRFGNLMTAALQWEGIPAYIIGIARGISATIGIAATFLYPILDSRISTIRTGLWSIWSQWICLLICVASIWVPNKLAAAYTLMSGVALSRIGLWMFDLSVIQQMQDHVAESDRCVVGGVQNSLQSVLDLASYMTGLIISNPQDFWMLILLSMVVVSLAAVLYSIHVFRARKHLIHFEKLYPLIQMFPRP